MNVKIQWFGHASFKITGLDKNIYIDPWKLSSASADGDIIFISHDHYDHLSPGDIETVAKPQCTVLCPPPPAVKSRNVQVYHSFETFTFGDISIMTIPAYNIGKKFHPQSNGWCGAVIFINDVNIYYAGDTDRIPEMSRLENIDVALLPVGGTYTMNPEEAAQAAMDIKCACAIPYHWGDIVGSKADADDFAAQAVCKVMVMNPGDTVEF